MAYCKKCKKEIEPELHGNKFLCPDCHKFVKVEEDEKAEPQVTVIEKPEKSKKKEPEEIQEGPQKLIVAPKTIKYDASDLHMGEILINIGFAKDLNDLTRKNMKLAFSLMNMGALGKQVNAMESNENKKEDANEMIDKSLKQQLLQAQIENMSKGGDQKGTDPLSTMMLMRMMENQEKGKSSGDNGFMNNMMWMQMMQSMAKPQTDSSLKGEIAELKHQMQMQQMMNQQAQTQQGNQSSQQFMQQMESIRADRDKSIKEAEIVAQQEKDKNLQLAFENRRIELESRLKAMEREMKETGGGKMATQRLQQMKEDINAVKEMSGLIGNKEKGAGEYISETVANVATTLQPALTKLIEQKEQQKAMQQQTQQFPPEPTTPMPAEAYGAVEEATQNPGPQPSDMTQTEQDISNQMEEMYLKPSGKKVEKK